MALSKPYESSEYRFNQLHIKHGVTLEAVGPRSYVQPTVLAVNNPSGAGLIKRNGTNLTTNVKGLNEGTDN